MHSCLYIGEVRHRRFTPVEHGFRYRVFQVLLDLEELDQVFGGSWLWSTSRMAVMQFRRNDHLGDPGRPLADCVREEVQRQTGSIPDGPIRLLTNLRCFGYVINPVSYFFCYDVSGTQLQWVLAEVHNTPWGERHCYVLDEPRAPHSARHFSYRSIKAMHVSPFMPMDLVYDWHFSAPGEALSVHMALHAAAPGGDKCFDATMRLQRAPLNGPQLALALLRYPLMTLQVIAAIHWQALRLWLKGVPVHTHPAKPPIQTVAGKP